MEIPFLKDLVYIFCLSIGVLLICLRLKVPAIVGFLLTGVLCGPSALGLVENVHAVELLSEIGVVLLLFTIGMELSGEELARLKKPVFVGGTIQVVLTTGVMCGIAMLFGRTFPQSILIGYLATLSSTAIVLSILQQRGESEAPHGRLALSVLIFQDLAIVPMMLSIPLLAGQGEADPISFLLSAGRLVLILGGGWFLAYRVVPVLMRQVMRTRSRELFLMTSLGFCLAVAVGTAYLGLSLALGAFLAGLLLAESEYSMSVVEGILPFKDVFTSLFFIAVGMLLDVHFFIDHIGSVIALAVILITIKVLLAIPAMTFLGYPLRVAIMAAMSLGQIGEFSFVLAKSGVDHGFLDAIGYQNFLAASILTMVLTPGLISIAPKTARFIGKFFNHDNSQEKPLLTHQGELQDHLIIVGFGLGGKYLARTARETGIPYVILEMNPDTVRRLRDQEPIYHGDASHPLVLKHFGVEKARILVVVISDSAATRGITAAARKLNPSLHLIVRTRFLGEVPYLHDLGANDVIPEDFETSIEIFTRVLGYYLIPRQTIEKFVHSIRSENYEMVRDLNFHGANLPSLTEELLSGLEVTACKVEAGSDMENKKLLHTDLRRKHGVTIVGIRRKENIIASPGPDEELLAGDTVFLFGTSFGISQSIELFRAQV